MIRQMVFASFILSSWHLGAIRGIGLECGDDNCSPFCNLRNKIPASTLAVGENGGVLISPCSQTNGLSFELTNIIYVRFDILSISNEYYFIHSFFHNENNKSDAP